MEKLVLNLLAFSLYFAFMIGRYPDRISLKTARGFGIAGLSMLLLVTSIAKLMLAQTFSATLLRFYLYPETQFGVILGLGFLYLALLSALTYAGQLLQSSAR